MTTMSSFAARLQREHSYDHLFLIGGIGSFPPKGTLTLKCRLPGFCRNTLRPVVRCKAPMSTSASSISINYSYLQTPLCLREAGAGGSHRGAQRRQTHAVRPEGPSGVAASPSSHPDQFQNYKNRLPHPSGEGDFADDNSARSPIISSPVNCTNVATCCRNKRASKRSMPEEVPQ